MMGNGEYYGHRTMADGSHEPLTKDEAEALLSAVKTAQASRAEAMPTAEDALRMLISAEARLRELGWSKGYGLRLSPGDRCAVAQTGSTGMWTGRIDEDGTYVTFGDCVSKPREAWMKPLADLTDDERRHIEKCDRSEAAAYSAMIDRIAEQEADGDQPS